MSREQDERWLAVLAGKAQPTDDDTRNAALMREVILAEAGPDELPDAASTTRMMNLLRAKGAFDDPKPEPVKSPAPGGLSGLLAWLFPPVGGHAGRYAAITAAVLAIVAAPLVLRDPGSDDDGIKQLPPGTVQPAPPAASGAESIVAAQDPEQAAVQLLSVLARQGVAAQVVAEGNDRVVEARVAPAQRSAVAAELQPLGLALPADGVLRVRFRPVR